MMCLSEAWPRSIAVEELRRLARQRLGWDVSDDDAAIQQDIEILGKWLLMGYTSPTGNLVELHTVKSQFVVEVTDRPQASALVRYQARRGRQVTNLRHETVLLDDLYREMVSRLDGSRTAEALLEDLKQLVADGSLTVADDDGSRSPEAISQEIEQSLEQRLQQLARWALLVA